MKSSHFLTAAAFALTLTSFSGVPANAQSNLRDEMAPRATQNTARPHQRPLPPETATGTRTPRYVVDLLSIHADHESGATNLGDDEVTVVVQTPNYWLATERFEDFDNYETREIRQDQSCMWPARDIDGYNGRWQCDRNGAPNPGIIRFEVREHDEPLFDPFDLDLCILSNSEQSDLLAQAQSCAAADILVGQYEIDLTHYNLPQEGSTTVTSMTVGSDNDGVYTVTWRITRAYDIVDRHHATVLSQN